MQLSAHLTEKKKMKYVYIFVKKKIILKLKRNLESNFKQ